MRQTIQPSGVWDPRPRFAQAMKVGGEIHVSGQAPVDERGESVGEGDIETQTHQVFENLRRCLEAAGAGFDDVVKLNVYSTDLDAHLPTISAFRSRHFAGPVPSTTIQVSRLVRPEWLLEIEAVALLGESS
jgi:enamine deaminase RidA (YjgF/YER057c/UK114 family)